MKDTKRNTLNNSELLTLGDLCCKKTLFGNEHFLMGTAHQLRTNKDFYIRKIAEKAFQMGKESNK